MLYEGVEHGSGGFAKIPGYVFFSSMYYIRTFVMRHYTILMLSTTGSNMTIGVFFLTRRTARARGLSRHRIVMTSFLLPSSQLAKSIVTTFGCDAAFPRS